MEEYFDRLDAAFANLETLHPSQSDDRQVEDGRGQELHRGEPSGSHKLGEELEKKDARYKKLWNTRLDSQMAVLPPFDNVFPSVRRSLRAAGLVER